MAVAGYNLYVGGVKQNTALITTLTYDVAALASGTNHTVTVKAVDDQGLEGPAGSTTFLTKPGTVTNLSTTNTTTTSTTLTWTAVTGAANYIVESSADNAAWSVSVTDVTGTSHTIGRPDGSTRYYRMKASNATGSSLAYSSVVSVNSTATNSLILMQDDFGGVTIDTVKWTVTNPADGISITQNEKLLFDSDGTTTVASPDTNNIIGVTPYNDATLTLAATLEFNGNGAVNNYFELRKDANNFILLCRDTATGTGQNARVIIKVAGTNVYDFKSTVPLPSKRWMIEYDSANRMYISYHDGTNWVELDAATVKTYDIGTGLVPYIAMGAQEGLTNTYYIDQLRMTNYRYTTLLP